MTETFQTLADRHTIDYQRYRDEGVDLLGNQGMTDRLYLVNEDGEQLAIAGSGDCYGAAIETSEHIQALRQNACSLVLRQGDQTTPLTDSHLVRVSHLQFKITPYESNQRMLYSGAGTIDNVYERIQYQGFWIFARVYHRIFGKDRTTNVKHSMHQYFSVYDSLQL